MAGTVTIGCRLPNGLIIDMSDNAGNVTSVTLQGQSDFALQMGVAPEDIKLNSNMCGYTQVDADFWAAWVAEKTTHPKTGDRVPFAILDSQAVFEAKDQKSAAAIFQEVKAESTGFEPMDQYSGDIAPAA